MAICCLESPDDSAKLSLKRGNDSDGAFRSRSSLGFKSDVLEELFT